MQNGTAAMKTKRKTTSPFVRHIYAKNESAPTTCTGWRIISEANESRIVCTACVSVVRRTKRSPVVCLPKNESG